MRIDQAACTDGRRNCRPVPAVGEKNDCTGRKVEIEVKQAKKVQFKKEGQTYETLWNEKVRDR